MNWPFQTWHTIAVRRFGLSPDQFWDMPLRDWLALIGEASRAGVSRDDLQNLMKLYPDEGGDDGRD